MIGKHLSKNTFSNYKIGVFIVFISIVISVVDYFAGKMLENLLTFLFKKYSLFLSHLVFMISVNQ